MNNFRVVFYGLAVVAAVCFGDARAESSYGADFVKKLSDGGNFLLKNKFSLAAPVVSSLLLDQEDDALAALVDTVGISVDFYNRKSKNLNEKSEALLWRNALMWGGVSFGLDFGTNYAIRKIGKYLNRNGISVKSCLGDSAAVTISTDVIMHPQVLSLLFWTMVLSCL